MPTEKQIKANRRNSKKSTGPKTPEGKAAVAQNATKHGLTSRNLVLSDEDSGAFMELRIELNLEFRPVGSYETMLVNRIAQDMWRLQRVPAIEAELFEELAGDMLGRDEGLGAAFMKGCHRGDLFGRLVRYESTISRRVSAAVRELAMLRGTRKGQAALPVNLPATPATRLDQAADLIERAERLRAEKPEFLSGAKAEQQQERAKTQNEANGLKAAGEQAPPHPPSTEGNANERLARACPEAAAAPRESPTTPPIGTLNAAEWAELRRLWGVASR